MDDRTASKRFAALGQLTRLALFAVISECDGTQNVRALTDRLCQRIERTVNQPAISHHLTILRNAGLVECHEEANESFYRVRVVGLALCQADLTELTRGKQPAKV